MENRDHARSSLGGLVGLLSMLIVTAGAVVSGLGSEKSHSDVGSDTLAIDPAAAVNGQGKVPDWFRQTALWYGEGRVSEREFLDAIAYLIDKDLIVLNRAPE